MDDCVGYVCRSSWYTAHWAVRTFAAGIMANMMDTTRGLFPRLRVQRQRTGRGAHLIPGVDLSHVLRGRDEGVLVVVMPLDVHEGSISLLRLARLDS